MLLKTPAPTETTQLLRSVPLFADANDKQLAAIASVARPVEFAAGAVICGEGSSGVGLHVIAEGSVEVSTSAGFVGRLGPGAYFGEIAVVDGGQRMATVVAETPVRTLAIVAWEFKAILDEQPAVARHLLTALCRRLRAQAASPNH